ncbi:AAA family ATPase [Patescibacteria group bacterium]
MQEKDGTSYLPIGNSDITAHSDIVNDLLMSFKWRTRLSRADIGKNVSLGWPENAIPQERREISIATEFKVLAGDALLIPDPLNTILSVIRDGAAIGGFVVDDISKRVGFKPLDSERKRSKGSISSEREREWRDKQQLLSVIQLFTLAYYVNWNLRDYQKEELGNTSVEFPGVIDIDTSSAHAALKSVLYYYGSYLSLSGKVNSDMEVLKFTVVYFEKVLEYLQEYFISTVRYSETFTQLRYAIEGSGFTIEGFDLEYADVEVEAVELKEVQFDEVIGNHIAKSRFKRAIEFLGLYNPDAKDNATRKLAGFPSVVMIQGKPGGGKTLLMSAVGTYARMIAQNTRAPLKIIMYPRNLVSKYQGVSAERVDRFWKSTNDPRYIWVIIMDEAEEILPDRDDEHVSSGAKAGTNGFLVATEGAEVKDYGNRIVMIATNHAHMIDSAVRSRIKEKIEVNGAETPHDYIDFINLVLSHLDPAFDKVVSLKAPKKYEIMSDQGKTHDQIQLKNDSPVINGLDSIVANVNDRFRSKGYDFFGNLCYLFQRANPGFSLRDLRNIMEATIFELTNFDIPSDYYGNEEDGFQSKIFDEQLVELRELLEGHLKRSKINFPEILFSNMFRQMKELESIEQIEFNRMVEKEMMRQKVFTEAQMRVGR